jgi:hypothetical protein
VVAPQRRVVLPDSMVTSRRWSFFLFERAWSISSVMLGFSSYDNGVSAEHNSQLTGTCLQSSWCSLIARRTYTLQHGSRSAVQQQPVSYTGLLTALATSAYRVVMVFTSVVVSFALSMIPFVGPFASFVFLSWIDA